MPFHFIFRTYYLTYTHRTRFWSKYLWYLITYSIALRSFTRSANFSIYIHLSTIIFPTNFFLQFRNIERMTLFDEKNQIVTTANFDFPSFTQGYSEKLYKAQPRISSGHNRNHVPLSTAPTSIVPVLPPRIHRWIVQPGTNGIQAYRDLRPRSSCSISSHDAFSKDDPTHRLSLIDPRAIS